MLRVGNTVWLKNTRGLATVIAVEKYYYLVEDCTERRFTSRWPRTESYKYLEPVIMSFVGPILTEGGSLCASSSGSLWLLSL